MESSQTINYGNEQATTGVFESESTHVPFVTFSDIFSSSSHLKLPPPCASVLWTHCLRNP